MQTFLLGQKFDASGNPLNGGLAYFRGAGGTTPEDVYEDAGLTTPHSYPIVADSSGRFPALVYLDPAVAYRYDLLAAGGVIDVSTSLEQSDQINETTGGSGIENADLATGAVDSRVLADGAIEAKLGYTPADDAEFTALQTAYNTLSGAQSGMLGYFLSASAPTGWVKANGGTIGDATSGGTTRANADTSALFALIWALDATNFPITDSGGGASTRGASASDDFAAHKRLPLPDLRAEFVRGLDDSRGVDTAAARVVGSTQAGQLASHTHTFSGGNNGASNQYVTTQSNTASPGVTTAAAGGTENSSENRPRNVAMLACIKL